MSVIEWTEKLSVGIASIDVQHRKLVNMINELQDAMSKGKGKEILSKIFDELVAYTTVHFNHEEKLFATHGYLQIASHKQEHAELVKQALDLQKKFKEGNLSISIKTLDFLSDWLKNHIQGTDKQYTAFLLSKGVR